MEPDPRGWAEERGKVTLGRAEVAWEVPSREALSAPACVRNAGIANRMNAERPAHRRSARSVEPP